MPVKRFRTKGTLLGLSAAAAAIAVVLALLGTGCFGMFGCGLMCGACGAACSDSCSELTGESCFDPDVTAEPAWDGPGSIRTTPQPTERSHSGNIRRRHIVVGARRQAGMDMEIIIEILDVKIP